MEKKEKRNYDDQTRIFGLMRAAIPYIMIAVVVILIRVFIATPVRVDGSSMYPNLKNGEVLILNKLDHKYRRFDIVVVNVDDTKIIKRIIGLPGESIAYRDCKLYINDEEVEDYIDSCITDDFSLEGLYNYAFIPEGYYFVMGDNRRNSSDSRDYRIGLISKDQIEGTTSIRLFPFNRMGKLK